MKFNLPFTALITAEMFCCAAFAGVAEQFKGTVQPILENHCTKCHGEDTQKAKIDLSGDRDLESLTADPHLWFRMLDQLEFQEMPPEDEAPLSEADRLAVIDWIKGELTASLAEKRQREGRSQFRRLSRTEFSNTFYDLFGEMPDPNLLPEDGRVEGYTKVSAALPMSTDGAYGYYNIAADMINQWVFKRPRNPAKKPTIHRVAAMESGQSPGHTLELPDGWFVSFNSDDTSGRLAFGRGESKYSGCRTPGVHKIRAHIYAYQSEKPLTVGIYTGKTAAYPKQVELSQIIEAPPGKPAIVETEVYLNKRDRFLLMPFGIGVQVPKNHQANKCKGPGLAIQYVEIEEPESPRADEWITADFPEEHRRAMMHNRFVLREKGPYSYKDMTRDDFTAVLMKTICRIAPSILRRDLSQEEMASFEAGIRDDLVSEVPMRTIFDRQLIKLLTNPAFFCVIESPGELNGFELASRLSYFLWNSCPDDELLSLAREGKLTEPATLREQTERLLNDPRSARFVKNFLDQWLELHAIDDTRPDSNLYPEYDDLLKFSSVRETRATFSRILQENRSVRDFAAPDWVLANRRLAEHYGLANVRGEKLQPVSLPSESPFGGIWTQPAVLKVTADGSSTSPVKRGVWIARRLLGVEISPPPPNIEPINPDTSGASTVREQLALHSSKGSCKSCHEKFDPYGFVLESFDVMGQYRTRYRVLDQELASLPPHQRKGKQLWNEGLPVDASGVTPEGEEFQNIVELRRMLAEQPEKLAWGVTWHLATYATAEPTGPLDRAAIQEIVDSAAHEDHGLRSLIHGIVQSELFRWK